MLFLPKLHTRSYLLEKIYRRNGKTPQQKRMPNLMFQANILHDSYFYTVFHWEFDTLTIIIVIDHNNYLLKYIPKTLR